MEVIFFILSNVNHLNETPVIRSVQSLAVFLEIRTDELSWLCHFLRSDEEATAYKHYQHRWLQKRSRGWRLIESPKPLLKYVQRKILSGILNHMPPHPLACGFAPGKSVLDHLKPHVGRPVQLKMDLSHFFSHITIGRVHGMFRAAGFSRDVSHRLAMLTTVATPRNLLELHGLTHFRELQSPQRQLLAKRHLPQGAPTSPAIANLCAFRLDQRLSGLARSLGGVHYTRYADDLLFSGNRSFRHQANRLSSLVGAIAIEEGFELNFRKTKTMDRHQRQSACGVVLNSKMNIERREYDRLKAILHNCVKHGLESQNRNEHANYREHLLGKIAWVTTLNPSKGEKLKTVFMKIKT